MSRKTTHWEIISKALPKSSEEIIGVLLENRKLLTEKEKNEFFRPASPEKISLKNLKIDQGEIKKSVARIEKAIKSKETAFIYGDYDADGVCSTAILWETLWGMGLNVTPHIPDRFSEGYGINPESVERLKREHPELSLIITVDNGIVAFDAVKKANEMGIDVIITDHHEKDKVFPDAYSVIHTTLICGSGVAWFFARELKEILGKFQVKEPLSDGLELAAIGTIADQLPLIGANRSLAKYGLTRLNQTKRPGLIALFEEAGLGKRADMKGLSQKSSDIGTYEVNYLIAPRINAMGRMEKGIESLRLLCTTSKAKASELASFLGRTNKERQRVVDEVILHARTSATGENFKGAIVLAHESYHEGVIGLAAGKLVEEFYRPAIVFSKGKDISKASARSIAGFNIIENIRKVAHLLEGAGGHEMAAGFSIRTEKLELFIKEFEAVSAPLLTEELLNRKLKIDLELDFGSLTAELTEKIADFAPTGTGNPAPVFVSYKAVVTDAKTVGGEGKHLKLTLFQDGKHMDAIAFNMGFLLMSLKGGTKVDIAYNLEENIWNGRKSLQLKLKDIHFKDVPTKS